MESSDTELNRSKSSDRKHEQDTSNLKTRPSETRLSPSSSSKSSSTDPSLDDHHLHNDDDKSASSAASSYAHKSDPVVEKSVPKPEPSDSSPVNEAATEAPHNQEMGRSPTAYRIPPSVFERSQSSTPRQWSVASNESLFSIHTGNMSFTNDHFLWRSGELGPPAEAASTSDQMFSYSAHDSSGGAAPNMRNHELGIAEATMLEVIKESEGQNHATSLAEVRHARRSEGSNTSNKSFAFSVMGGDTGSSVRMPSSVRQVQSQPQSQSLPLEPHEPEQKIPVETGNAVQSKWVSCFSCCSSR